MKKIPREIRFFNLVFKSDEPQMTVKPGGFEMVYRVKFKADGVPDGAGPTLSFVLPTTELTDVQHEQFIDNFNANIAKWLANYFFVSVTMDELAKDEDVKIGGTD